MDGPWTLRRHATTTHTYANPDRNPDTTSSNTVANSFWRRRHVRSGLECQHNVRFTRNQGEQKRHQLPERILDNG
jgi:hypothetical protein